MAHPQNGLAVAVGIGNPIRYEKISLPGLDDCRQGRFSARPRRQARKQQALDVAPAELYKNRVGGRQEGVFRIARVVERQGRIPFRCEIKNDAVVQAAGGGLAPLRNEHPIERGL